MIPILLGAEQWMTVTQPPPAGCPPGLEYLTAIDQLIVKQQIELLEGRVFFATKWLHNTGFSLLH